MCVKSMKKSKNITPAWLEDLYYNIKGRLFFTWIVITRLPIVKCPRCKGKCGEMQNLPCGNEWWECSLCFDSWYEIESWCNSWFAGRIHPLDWVRIKLNDDFYPTPLLDQLACSLGKHEWHEEEDEWDRRRVCMHCYEYEHICTKKDGIENGK